MASQTHDPILFQCQVASRRADFDNLAGALNSPFVQQATQGVLSNVFRRFMNPLRRELDAVAGGQGGTASAQAWGELTKLQRESQELLGRAQAFLGGVSIRDAGLDGGLTRRAEEWAVEIANRVGETWTPAVVIADGGQDAQEVADNPGDSLIPLPRWDIWCLPLVAQHYGYWVAKRGRVRYFDQFVGEQSALLVRLLSDSPPAPEEAVPFRPELWDQISQRRASDDWAEYREQLRPALNGHAEDLKIYLWNLIADALATYLIGPAYASALIFLVLNPTGVAAEEGGGDGSGPSSSPSDLCRAAIVLHTLGAMDEATREDDFADGAYGTELGLLARTWEDALEAAGRLGSYRSCQSSMAPWFRHICEGLDDSFGSLAQGTAQSWREAIERVVPVVRNGGAAAPPFELPLVVSAAWWCRPRYFDRVRRLTIECEKLLAGQPPAGLLEPPRKADDGTSRLLHSRLYDLESDIERLRELFDAESLPRADRDAVAGRFLRLLSAQDYDLQGLKGLISRGAPAHISLEVVRQVQGGAMRELRREALDFLGGVLLRRQELDNGVCALAEALLRDYSRMTGVNWTSRVVLGSDPLFSTLSDIVHHRFPDWDIWSLPLMAHEFGHLTALFTPAFGDLSASELAVATQGHPEAARWGAQQREDYVGRRGRHLHEFFADSFAVYCQGPAFAYNVLLLHFNPVESYLPRGNHPTHAERVEVLLQVLAAMSGQEKRDEADNGPFDAVVRRLRAWWDKSVEAGGSEPGEVDRFLKLQAKSLAAKLHKLLNKHYRLGARYEGRAWASADERAQALLDGGSPPPGRQDIRDLLNVAWAGRVRHPDRAAEISKSVRAALTQLAPPR